MGCSVNLSGWHIPHRWGECRCGHAFSREQVETMRRAMREYELTEQVARVRLGVA
jgi:hypothetical protein